MMRPTIPCGLLVLAFLTPLCAAAVAPFAVVATDGKARCIVVTGDDPYPHERAPGRAARVPRQS